jgi:hypothetical protein
VRSFAARTSTSSSFVSASTLTSSSSSSSLSMPLRRRFASSPQQQHLQQSFLKPVLAAAAVAGGFYLYQEVVANRESEAKTSSPKTSSPKASTSDKVADKATTEKATTPVAPVGQEGKKAAEAAEVKPSPPVALNKDEFREFELVEVEDLTPNTRRLRFALPSRDHVLGLPVASCVVTKADIGNYIPPLQSLLGSLFAPISRYSIRSRKSARKRSDDLARVAPHLARQDDSSSLALCVVCAVCCVGENGKPVIRPYTPVTNDKADKGYFDFVIKVQRLGSRVVL